MPLERTQCPRCGKSFRFATEHLGSKTRCKSCRAIFVITRPEAQATTAQPAKPVQAKPVQAKPVQAVQAKPIDSTPAATPLAAKPAQTKPGTVAAPSSPTAAGVVEESSPYEAFAEEMMTGTNAVSAQRLASTGNANAAQYLRTHRQLNLKRKQADNDWATTFIFRGFNLAIFGFLLFGISMTGLMSLVWMVAGPIGSLLGVTIGFIGCVMVIVGFSTKPGKAAIMGVFPALMFLAGGGLVVMLYFQGFWAHSSPSLAMAHEHKEEHLEQNGGQFAPDIAQRLQPRIDQVIDEQTRLMSEPRNAAPRRPRQQPGKQPWKAPDEQAPPANELPVDPFRDPLNRLRPQDNLTKEFQEDARREIAKMRNRMNRSEPGAGFEPGKRPPRPRFGMNPPDRNSDVPDDTDPNSVLEPVVPPADDNDASPDAVAGGPETPEVNEFADFQTSNAPMMRVKRDLERNARARFGNMYKLQFPQNKLTAELGQQTRKSRIGNPYIGSSGEPVVGFHAWKGPFDRTCRGLVPVFSPSETHVSIARPGYALGGFEAAFENNKLVGIRAIYMKLNGNRLDKDDQYDGQWFGDTALIKNATRKTSGGKVPIGIRTQGGMSVETLSLITK